MRKLKLQMQQTVDGYVAGINGELNWMTFGDDTELFEVINELTDTSDNILLGRKMTEDFIKYWENVVNNQPDSPEFSFAEKMVNTPKIVFSKTLKSIGGKNTTLENDDLVTAINQLKNKPGKDILVYGGANFVSSLLKNNLIDELYLFINPVAIGNGMKIFMDRTNLKLIDAKAFQCGEVLLQYKLKN
ncbi:MAG: dihydrofolate reductase family protein [Flammeovirgaceae bacterium]|jgi:dihydrofolate reductase|nr:dihydrofolate reductase family protein [Flammeovirgaceae bacterium]